LVQLLLRRGANAGQSNLRGKTPVDVAATDVIGRLLRGADNNDDNDDDPAAHRHPARTDGQSMMSLVSSDDSNQSASPLPAAASPAPASVNPAAAAAPARLTPGSDPSSYLCTTCTLGDFTF